MPNTRRVGRGLLIPEQTAPGTPASGYMEVYAKSDGILYYKNDSGVEVALTDDTDAEFLAWWGAI